MENKVAVRLLIAAGALMLCAGGIFAFMRYGFMRHCWERRRWAAWLEP